MMTLSLSIVGGFQEEIEKKVIGFGSHIQITNYQSKGIFEHKPISKNRPFYPSLDTVEGIRHIQVFANKAAILKTDENNFGVVIKGVSDDYDWSFFKQYIKQGKAPKLDGIEKSNELLISEFIANKLNLKLGDELLLYFVQQPPRLRKLKISGIYNTGLGEMDEKMVIADIRHIQKLNGWDKNQVGGFEVLIDNMDELDKMDEYVYQQLDYDLTSISIKDARMDIFNWLELQDINVVIIIGLLILVCGIDIISALLILILERTSTIGVLKAMGAKNKSIRKIFIYNATYLIVMGLFFGNLLGIGISLLQLEFGFMTLPQEAYFIDKVPIKLDYMNLILLNLGTLLSCMLMLVVPSNIVAKISPVRAIRFD